MTLLILTGIAIISILADHKYSPPALEMALHASKNRQYGIDLAGIEASWYGYRVSKVSNLSTSVSISFLLLVSAEHYPGVWYAGLWCPGQWCAGVWYHRVWCKVHLQEISAFQ